MYQSFNVVIYDINIWTLRMIRELKTNMSYLVKSVLQIYLLIIATLAESRTLFLQV